MSEKKPTYWELLKHPKWQEKRLRIMERAGFKCEQCDTNEVTLNVHHKYYTKGANPWDYPDHALQCLCEPCHGEADELRQKLSIAIGLLESYQAWTLLGIARGLQMEAEPSQECEAENYEVLNGMVRVFLTLSGHQTVPATSDAITRIQNGRVNGQILFEVCKCSEVAAAAKIARDEWNAAKRAKGSK